jgi:hypothetical protein
LPRNVTLAVAYQDYLERGGNRRLVKKVLEELGSTPIDQLDRSALIDHARRLYPKCQQSERHNNVIDPVGEIVGGYKPRPARPAGGHFTSSEAWKEYQFQTQRLVKIEAEQAINTAILEHWGKDLPRLEDVAAKPAWATEQRWLASLDPWGLKNPIRWASVDRPPVRKPDLRIPDYVWGTPKEQADHKLRDLFSATFHPHEGGWHREIGHRPDLKPGPIENPYYGYLPQSRGRPRKARKFTNAEKTKRWRDKKRAKKAKKAARDHYLWMLERLPTELRMNALQLT